MGKTLSDKVWENHVVRTAPGEPDLLYIDLHLVHEVTSPQAFDGLRLAGRGVRRTDLTMATEDHNTPTLNILSPIADPVSKLQVDTLRKNAADFGVRIHSLGDLDQGVVHIIGPQLGLTQPGLTVVCGDSHTSTHGAFGALAFGIGTSEVEHVLATQTLPQARPKTMAVNINGELPDGVTAKDIVLTLIAKVGTGGGQGYVVEYRGSTIENLSMEGRMTICNMSIEWGAKAGMMAPDEVTFAYLKGRPHAPVGDDWDAAVAYWRTLYTDADAVFDREVDIDAATLTPFVTWGTNPGQGVPLGATAVSYTHLDVYKRQVLAMSGYRFTRGAASVIAARTPGSGGKWLSLEASGAISVPAALRPATYCGRPATAGRRRGRSVMGRSLLIDVSCHRGPLSSCCAT